MILFSLWALLSVLRFRRYHSRPFSPGWWTWITAAAIFMGAAFAVKYLAIYSCWLCCFVLLRDFWRRLSDRGLNSIQLAKEFVVCAGLVSLVPAAIYIGSFWIHLTILTKAGVHDSLMTSAFQASLEGGLSSIVQGQPLEIAHGSQITLRHTHGKTCWMHSHEHVYPVR
jgi:dolichyl-phosphate-mannose-protein mannosyltransferase